MKNLIIFGTGEFALESYYWLRDMIEQNDDCYFKGFLSTNNDLPDESEFNKYYLGNEYSYHFDDADYIVVAIAGNLALKEKIVKILNEKECNFFNIIHPTSIINSDNIGKGNIFSPYTIVTFDVEINDHNSFNCYASVGHHVKIGSYNTVNSHCDITGHCVVGNFNFFGSSAVMLPNAIIGDNNKVAANSVIYKKFRNNTLISGNPAIKLS